MALVVLGTTLGQASGRIGGTVFSKNRAGVYIRNGTKPVNTYTIYRAEVKARLSAASQHWVGMSLADRTAWNVWAAQIPWKNRLGQSISLTGQQACIQCNARILAVGAAMIDVPSLSAPPENISNVTVTRDIGSGTFNLAWTSGALGATEYLWLRGCILETSSRQYVTNLFRWFMTSPAAATTPQTLETAVAARFGTLQVGQIFVLEYSVIDSASGLVSSVFTNVGAITDTP